MGIKIFNIDSAILEETSSGKLLESESMEGEKKEMTESDTEQVIVPDPTYNWNIQPYEVDEHVVAKATPEELLHMSAKGGKITGEQFLFAANKLKSDPRLKRDGTLATTLHKLYDKAAEKYMADGNIGKAFEIRSIAAQTVPILKTHQGKKYPLVDDKGNISLVTTVTGEAEIIQKPVDAFIKVATDGYFNKEMWSDITELKKETSDEN